MSRISANGAPSSMESRLMPDRQTLPSQRYRSRPDAIALRFVPTSLYAGAAVSGLTLVVSLVTCWRVSRTIDARASS